MKLKLEILNYQERKDGGIVAILKLPKTIVPAVLHNSDQWLILVLDADQTARMLDVDVPPAPPPVKELTPEEKAKKEMELFLKLMNAPPTHSQELRVDREKIEDEIARQMGRTHPLPDEDPPRPTPTTWEQVKNPVRRNDPSVVDGEYNRMKELISIRDLKGLSAMSLPLLERGLKDGLFRYQGDRLMIARLASVRGVVQGENPNFNFIPPIYATFTARYASDLDPVKSAPDYKDVGGARPAETVEPTNPNLIRDEMKILEQELGIELTGEIPKVREYRHTGDPNYQDPSLAQKIPDPRQATGPTFTDLGRAPE